MEPLQEESSLSSDSDLDLAATTAWCSNIRAHPSLLTLSLDQMMYQSLTDFWLNLIDLGFS
jgi:hypothetical protein